MLRDFVGGLFEPGYFIAEWLLLFALIALLHVWPPGQMVRSWIKRLARIISQHPRGAIVCVAILPVLLRVLLLPLYPVPQPTVHDEFSLLLGADTFANGRLANPTHPHWPHFESFHILHQPVYVSKYQPAQMAIMAFGQVLGHPWIGILLTVVFMNAAVAWMLAQWLPLRWAIAGAALGAVRYGLFSYWTNSYWGGALTAGAGALVLGVAGSVWRKRRFTPALGATFCTGAVILANRRPYEGLVLCASILIFLGIAWLKGRRKGLAGFIAAAIAVAAPSALGMMHYNRRITGDALKMPYVLDFETYTISSLLLFRPLSGPHSYRHPVMQGFYLEEERFHKSRLERPVETTLRQLDINWAFYAGPSLTVAFLALPLLFRDRRIRPLLWISVPAAAALSFGLVVLPHYLSPWAGLWLAILIQMFRHLRLRWPRLAQASVLSVYFALSLPMYSFTSAWRPAEVSFYGWWYLPLEWNRPTLESSLLKQPGRHLVLVRYLPGHSHDEEWVYNAADIDNAPIVWAREMDAASNRKLLEYFSDRKAWLVETGREESRIFPIQRDNPERAGDSN